MLQNAIAFLHVPKDFRVCNMLDMSDSDDEIRLARFRVWVDNVLKLRPDLTPTSWAVNAGLAATTVTRPYKPKPGVKPSVPKGGTLLKLADYAGVKIPQLDTDDMRAIALARRTEKDKSSMNDNQSLDHNSATGNDFSNGNPVQGVGSLPLGEWGKTAPPQRNVRVVGAVRAGAFMEVNCDYNTYEGAREVPFPSRRYAHIKDVWALDIEGDSCNKKYPAGSTVFCARQGDVPLTNGRFVVFERPNSSGQVETTVKQFYQREDGTVELWPRSYSPLHQTPFIIPKYDPDNQDGPRICGVVIGKYVEDDDDIDL